METTVAGAIISITLSTIAIAINICTLYRLHKIKKKMRRYY